MYQSHIKIHNPLYKLVSRNGRHPMLVPYREITKIGVLLRRHFLELNLRWIPSFSVISEFAILPCQEAR